MDPTVTVALISGAVALALFFLTNRFSDQRVARAAVITEADKDKQRRADHLAAEEEKRDELEQFARESRAEARRVLDAANATAVAIQADAERRRAQAQAEAEAYSIELRRAKDEEISDLKSQIVSLREQLQRRAP